MKRRTFLTIAGVITGLCGAVALVNAILMRDFLMPRARLGLGYAAALDYSILTEDLAVLNEQAKKKYGPDASAAYSSEHGAMFQVGDKIVERVAMPRHIVRIYGMFAVGRGGGMQRFPYSIVPDETERDRREPIDRRRLRRFQERAPKVFAFNDVDWQLEGCRTVATPRFGYDAIDRRLRLGSTDLCRVRWLKDPQATMLIGGVAAEGGPWIRDWVVPLCRMLAKGWLGQLPADAGKIDYVACNLIYDPHHPTGGPGVVAAERVYQVTDGGLAVIE